MKVLLSCILVLQLLGFQNKGFSNSVSELRADTIKILTYNIRNCRGLDDSVSVKRTASVINQIGAQVVALQELDSATIRNKNIYLLGELASLTGKNGTYGAAIDYQGGKYGVGILSLDKPLNIKSIPLPGKEEKRRLLITEFDKFVIACTHLSLTEADRKTSVELINNTLQDYSKPVFLAGDLNDLPESDFIKALENKWELLTDPNLPTFPANKPDKCIDYIFALKNNKYRYKVLKTSTETEPVASDHVPLWVQVEIRY